MKDEAADPTNPEQWDKWHDAFVRFEGPAVCDLQKFFVERWAVNSGEYLSRTDLSYFPAPVQIGPARVKVLTNVPGLERDITGEYLRLFRGAQQKILVQNPYVTDDLIAVYLAHAADARGIPVEIIVPDKHLDFWIARALMKTRWDALRRAGITLYANQKRMTHVKVATVDSRYSLIGAYNFAKSSAAQLFECGISVDDPEFAQQVERRIFDVDRPLAEKVTASTETDWENLCAGFMGFLDRFV